MTKLSHLVRWAVPLAWAGVIYFMSTPRFNPEFSSGLLVWVLRLLHLHVSARTFELLHTLLRKSAHLTEYGIFALLLYVCTGEPGRKLWQPRRAFYCVLAVAAYSLTDEFHQVFSPGRHASLLDCGLDTVGAGLAMLVPYARQKIAPPGASMSLANGPDLTGPSVHRE